MSRPCRCLYRNNMLLAFVLCSNAQLHDLQFMAGENCSVACQHFQNNRVQGGAISKMSIQLLGCTCYAPMILLVLKMSGFKVVLLTCQ